MTGPQGKGSAATVERLCALTGLSRASYYRDWASRAPAREEAELRDLIQRTALSRRYYGYRRITHEVRRQGHAVNHKRVLRIMREDNLLCLRKRKFRPATTDSDHRWPIWPNLARKVRPTAINQLWVADITYVRLDGAFIYLAVIIDVFSRKVIGWALEDHLRAELALQALEMALRERKPSEDELIHHTDRGVQYACGDYIQRLLDARIQPSMSRAGCPYDNAMAESFMKTLKTEEVDAAHYRDINHARASIANFIDDVYNRQRLHSALNYIPPEDFEFIHSPVDRLTPGHRTTATTVP